MPRWFRRWTRARVRLVLPPPLGAETIHSVPGGTAVSDGGWGIGFWRSAGFAPILADAAPPAYGLYGPLPRGGRSPGGPRLRPLTAGKGAERVSRPRRPC